MSRRKKKIEEWILDFDLYEVDEKARVEAFVAANPEWDACFLDARRWAAMLRDAKKLADGRFDEENLPYAVASESLPHGAPPHPIGHVLQRIFSRSQRSEYRRERLSRLRSRKVLGEARSHASRHFEQLTGHRVAEPEENAYAAAQPAMRRRRASSRSPLAGRLARVTAVVALAYIGLFIASSTRDDPVDRIAHLTASDFDWTRLGVSSRGEDVVWTQIITSRYEHALTLAADARVSVLGLFPTYRTGRLLEARKLLEETMAMQLTREPVPRRAYITLAKLHFLLGDSLESLDALRTALERDLE